MYLKSAEKEHNIIMMIDPEEICATKRTITAITSEIQKTRTLQYYLVLIFYH